MNDRETIETFLGIFPCCRTVYDKHIQEYGELLQHVFYSEVISNPLIELLEGGADNLSVSKYAGFIELMWREGGETAKNVVDVTILERLSDDKDTWHRFGMFISDDFRNYINNELIPQNCAMFNVDKL